MDYYKYNRELPQLVRGRKNFLIDLDGTLLENRAPFFLYANILLMVKRFGPLFGWHNTVGKIRAGLSLILEDSSSRTTTNYQTLHDFFLQNTRQSDHDTIMRLWDFYLKDFPQLKALTYPVKGAQQALHSLRSKGKKLFLATNPIWPEVCVIKRLEWADLSASLFEQITHSQNWSACKPSTLYYQKILHEWSLDPEDCLMIGNDVKKDWPATSVGIPCLILPERNKSLFWQNLNKNLSKIHD